MAKKNKSIRIFSILILLGAIFFIFSDDIIRYFNIWNNKQSKISEKENSFNNISLNNSMNNNKQNILLVNKEYGLEKGYEPDDLEAIQVNSNKEILLRKEASENLKRMFKDAEKEGIYLLAVSGYRSYEYQEDVYTTEVFNRGEEYADKYVAKPGYSEHQTGLAVDVLAENYTDMDINFENTEECRWLHNNMYKYGFILRYIKGKEDITGYSYEPWHIRYVGIEHSNKIKEKCVCLEEYLGK